MTAHMMLISELLPTGSLLDYVRVNQYDLGSDTLLLWAKQIAEVHISADHNSQAYQLLALLCALAQLHVLIFLRFLFNQLFSHKLRSGSQTKLLGI